MLALSQSLPGIEERARQAASAGNWPLAEVLLDVLIQATATLGAMAEQGE